MAREREQGREKSFSGLDVTLKESQTRSLDQEWMVSGLDVALNGLQTSRLDQDWTLTLRGRRWPPSARLSAENSLCSVEELQPRCWLHSGRKAFGYWLNWSSHFLNMGLNCSTQQVNKPKF